MQPYLDTFSTVPLRGVTCSYMEAVVGMQTILLVKPTVPELVDQVHDNYFVYQVTLI